METKDWLTGRARVEGRKRENDDKTTEEPGDIDAYRTSRLTDLKMIC